MSDSVIAPRETGSPPQAKACGVFISGEAKRERAALYIDGFNLYHAIDDLKVPYLKWLNLWALGERLLPRKRERLVRVFYCSAKKPNSPEKNKRHDEYMAALRHYGVEIVLGSFISDDVECHGCRRVWEDFQEKQSDVNLALTVFDDAYRNVFDHAYLLTADSDQGATARMLRLRFPDKKLTSVVPPGKAASKAIMTHTSHQMTITKDHLEECLLPPILVEPINGKSTLIFRRPPEYATPAGWVAPQDRPKRKPGKP